MKNVFFKSTEADLQKVIPVMIAKLDLVQKNVLYITYQVDKILKIEQENMTDKGLQAQVDEFFDKDATN